MNDEEGSDHDDVFDVRKIYWDSDGNLRHGEAFYVVILTVLVG